ncbi:MAG: PaaI family thioesterase [Deltaproteobacteria bacterium]|nr:PaaI family thioesterase [Deltaproteobacteria bacterium]MBW2362146.1 PaaI family thioesterase [Deltaproteobacteria bacterium]
MAKQYLFERIFRENPNAIVDSVPHCVEIGMQCVQLGPGTATLMIPYRKEFVGDPSRGVVFGGIITTLLDQAGGAATLCSLAEFTSMATIDLRIDYLRAAEPGLDLFGSAECYKRTPSVAFVRGKAWDRDTEDPFANYIATYMLGSKPNDPLGGDVKAEQSK